MPMKTFLFFSPMIWAVLVIVLPFVILIILNTLLVNHLRAHRKSLEALGSRSHRGSFGTPTQRETRATYMVCSIVGSFLFFNSMDAVLHLLNFWYPELYRYHIHKIAVEVSNSLVVTAKALNFVLFCMSSRYFRKKAWLIMTRKKESVANRLALSSVRLSGNDNMLQLQQRPLVDENATAEAAHSLG